MAVTNYDTVNGRIVGENTNGVQTDYMRDALGSVTGTTVSGVVQSTFRYKPSGGLLAKTGTAADPKFQWNGGSGYRATQRAHSDLYVGARHFGSAEGLWTTIDLLWPSQLAFGYVGGSPASMIDPTGLGPPGPASCEVSLPDPPPLQNPLSNCPPGLLSQLNAAYNYICANEPDFGSPIVVASLLACANSKMPKGCGSYVPPGVSGLQSCMSGWCKLGPTFQCGSPDCKPNDCSLSTCLSQGLVMAITICPGGIDNGCIAKGCSTGSSNYGVPGPPNSGGCPPALQAVLHEALHYCVATCGDPQKNPKCMEAYTEALTVCIIQAMGCKGSPGGGGSSA